MWKKDDEQTGQSPSPSQLRSDPPKGATASGRATIGPSISIRGDVTGSEDLLIQGKIDGSVMLEKHSVSVGSEGRVNANITGRVITIEGVVEGDLTAQEQIVLRGSAQVQGDIKAPRVVLEDGASFRGLVDMGSPREGEKGGASKGSPAASGPQGSKTASGPSGPPKPGGKDVSTSSGAGGSGGREAERKTGS